jgi:dihydropteroate synthase
VTADPGRAGGTASAWRVRRSEISLLRPVVMGILNVTPDSFSDGGRHRAEADAVAHAERMVREGAQIIDVGGESTRPGAHEVSIEEEAGRVLPVLRAVRRRLDVALSVDTRRAEIARAALEEGADIVNDVSALGDPAMARVVAAAGAGLVLMHMRGTPRTMQVAPVYEDVVREVRESLCSARDAAVAAGVAAERIVVDPGIGFGKTMQHNLALLRGLGTLADDGRPVLLGVSRKAFLGTLLGGVEAEGRDVATAAACALGWVAGARIFRVHDVRSSVQALRVADALHPAEAAA